MLDFDIEVNGRIRLKSILKGEKGIQGIETVGVQLPEGTPFGPFNVEDLSGTDSIRNDIDTVIISIGMRSTLAREEVEGVFYAGDMAIGPSTVVEAVASGKNTATEIDAYLEGKEKPIIENARKSHYQLPGYDSVPVSLETDFFGRKIRSPYLLSAAPPTDGLNQMRKAYDAGWAGGVMKTAFDNVPIHIPSEYMVTFGEETFGNFDNVSGHPLDRVCEEIKILIKEYPEITTSKLAESIGITQKGVDWQIKQLKEEGKLRRIGPAKGGYWEVVKDE